MTRLLLAVAVALVVGTVGTSSAEESRLKISWSGQLSGGGYSYDEVCRVTEPK